MMRLYAVLASILALPGALSAAPAAPVHSTAPAVSSGTIIDASVEPAPKPIPKVPRLLVGAEGSGTLSREQLDRIFDHSRTGQTAIPVIGEASDEIPDPLEEAPFDPSWQPVAQKLWSKSRKVQQAGLKSLAERFAADEESPTGLTADSPEALRMLALAIYDKRGGKEAFAELNRQLKTVAFLESEKKQAFAKTLNGPLPVYVALSASHSAHFSDAQAYFRRMKELLARKGTGVAGYIERVDPEERYAANFHLRLHAYDTLISHLNQRPQEAGKMAGWFFSAHRPDVARERAMQIQGVTSQLGAYGRKSGASESYALGLLEIAKDGSRVSRPAALHLKQNESLWPRFKLRIAEAVDPGIRLLTEDPRLTPKTPYEHWPADTLALTVHFPGKDSYANFLKFFRTRGYEVGKLAPEGVELVKTVGGVAVSLRATLHPSDEEGFLKGADKEKFLESVRRELRDPKIQGVVVRTHAQFYYPALFGKSVNPGKFWLDGSCRGSWYAEELQKRCGTCSAVGNASTGVGDVTDPALYSIVEGLALRKEWKDIGQDLKKVMPLGQSRFVGPWTPPFNGALDLLPEYPLPPSDASSTR